MSCSFLKDSPCLYKRLTLHYITSWGPGQGHCVVFFSLLRRWTSIPSRRSTEEIPLVTSCCRSRQTLVIWTCWPDSGSWKCHMKLSQTFCHNRHCSFVTNRACTVLRSPTHPDPISVLQAAPSFDAVTISSYPDLRLSFCRTFNLFLFRVQIKSNLFHVYFSIVSLAAPLSWGVLLRHKCAAVFKNNHSIVGKFIRLLICFKIRTWS